VSEEPAVKITHSYSAFKQFENCPRQYEKQRITKEVKASFGEASIYGNRVHEQLDQRLRGKPLPGETTKYEALCVAFENLPGELHSEQEYTLTQQLVPTGWWDHDAWFRSKLDILVLNGPDAVVGDWKTGKHRPDLFQMELFALQVFKHHPEVTNVTTSLIWLQDMRLDTETYRLKNIPALWEKFHNKVQRIEHAVEIGAFPAKPSGLCPWCPAKNICDVARI